MLVSTSIDRKCSYDQIMNVSLRRSVIKVWCGGNTCKYLARPKCSYLVAKAKQVGLAAWSKCLLSHLGVAGLIPDRENL